MQKFVNLVDHLEKHDEIQKMCRISFLDASIQPRTSPTKSSPLRTKSVAEVGDSPSNDVTFGKAAGVSTALVDTGRRHLEGAGERAHRLRAPRYRLAQREGARGRRGVRGGHGARGTGLPTYGVEVFMVF